MRIAIIGGGIGGLTAALALLEQARWIFGAFNPRFAQQIFLRETSTLVFRFALRVSAPLRLGVK